jgi:hypothetical protein
MGMIGMLGQKLRVGARPRADLASQSPFFGDRGRRKRSHGDREHWDLSIGFRRDDEFVWARSPFA